MKAGPVGTVVVVVVVVVVVEEVVTGTVVVAPVEGTDPAPSPQAEKIRATTNATPVTRGTGHLRLPTVAQARESALQLG
jgi:hypothetical protein